MTAHVNARIHCRRAPKTRFPLLSWIEIARQRRMLASLDDRTLSDMGLTRAQADHEAHRPFWDMD